MAESPAFCFRSRMSYKRTQNSPILARALEMLRASEQSSTDCRYDVFGDVLPRREGSLADVAGWRESEASLRRMCRQCYTDWLLVDAAIAHHMTKRLYEQLTGTLDASAAMNVAMHREYTTDLAWGKVETPASAHDRDTYRVIDGLRD